MFFKITNYERGAQFSYIFEKDDPKLPRKRNVLSYYEEEEAPVKFVSKLEKYYLLFYQETEIVVNCIYNRFQQKYHVETRQKVAILLLNALRDEDYDHKLQ